jgi:hypothetical protein
MSRTLKRPMFRRGGFADTGIMEGFSNGGDTVRRGTDTSPQELDSIMGLIDKASESAPAPAPTNPLLQQVFERKEMEDEPIMGLSDYASLFKLGANIASAPGRGDGLGGLLASAGPSLSQAADEFAASQEAKAARRRAFEEKEDAREDAFKATQMSAISEEFLLDKELENQLKLADREPLEKEFILNKAQELREKIASGDEKLREEAMLDMEVLYPERAKAKYKEMEEARNEGYKKFEDLADDIVERLEDGTATKTEKQLYTGKSAVEIATDMAIADVLSDYKFAEGGRVGLANGGGPFEPGSGPDPDPGSPPIMRGDSPMLTFEELRARLPREVSDQVVRLIATSEAALLDFANIDTQEDISIFNQKYNVDLQLPTQVA